MCFPSKIFPCVVQIPLSFNTVSFCFNTVSASIPFLLQYRFCFNTVSAYPSGGETPKLVGRFLDVS